jgi:glycosyltransferase involved in cell wall biosynthesis
MKVAVMIPAYNAGDSLGNLLADVANYVNLSDVIVVNDGSDDATSLVIEKFPVRCLAHVANCGKGRALRTGFEHALALGYDAVITLDADGQHDPGYIPSMVDIMDTGHWDIIVGSRRNDFRRMSFARYLSNNITTVVVSLLSGRKIEDSQCGYRLIRREVLEAIVLEADGYQMESELLIKAGRRGFSIGHIPIDIRSSATSHIKHLTDTWKFMVMAIKLLWT